MLLSIAFKIDAAAAICETAVLTAKLGPHMRMTRMCVGRHGGKLLSWNSSRNFTHIKYEVSNVYNFGAFLNK